MNYEKIKEFLKPSLMKVFVLIILFIVSSLLSVKDITPILSPELQSVIGINCCADVGFGFPLSHIVTKFRYSDNRVSFESINFINLLLDLVFWYLFSCLIIYFKKSKSILKS